MKTRLIACGVLEPELSRLVAASPNDVELHLLQAGLHDDPQKLRTEVQAAIDSAEGTGVEAVVIGYGLCGRGTSGLTARSVPVVIPRAHDCMTLFMGSRQAYREQFSNEPGTFYITPGWFEHKVRPLGREKERFHEPCSCVEQDPRFAPWAEQFGPEEATFLVQFHDSWKRNYTRAAYIDTGVSEKDAYVEYARHMARAFGWRYAEIPGNIHLLQKLVDGPWEAAEFLVLQPGQRSAATGDDSLLEAVTVMPSAGAGTPQPAPAAQPAPEPPALAPPPAPEPGPAAVAAPEKQAPATPRPAPGDACGIGIDAGGTYTDAVLYDLRRRCVLTKAKALTTYHDLSLGIAEALHNLSVADPAAVRMVALSTTLATNAIVEGKGGRPGAILMSPVGGTEAIRWEPAALVAGSMDIRGEELAAPDPHEIAASVRTMLSDGVDAFAVSGYGGVRNPAHELLVRDIIRDLCDLPVVCGHELSMRLDFTARANTAILNARLLSVISALLDAVKASLVERGINAPLLVVKGDGSLVNETTARERPVETILSGPAASISGARYLTRATDGIVFDMGGTTTDSALLQNGLPHIHPEGATVGGWRTAVEAADIATIGLGGDSALGFTRDRELTVGPRRVLPLCALAAESPRIREQIQYMARAHAQSANSAAALDFFRLGRPVSAQHFSPREQAVLKALAEGPLSRTELARRVGVSEPALLRFADLEISGGVQRAGLTPTDLLHVTGEFTAWDRETARTALGIFANLYGAAPEEIIRRAREVIIQRLCLQVIAHAIPGSFKERLRVPDTDDILLQLALDPAGSDTLSAALTYHGDIIALGAPVAPFFPEVGRRLNARVIIPEHAEVANAVGAVAGEVVVRETAVVRPGDVSAFVVHSRRGRREYEHLEEAVKAGRADAETLALDRARYSGAADPMVSTAVNERQGLIADGGYELIEVLIEATAAGHPVTA